jgi:predicted small secreted protein
LENPGPGFWFLPWGRGHGLELEVKLHLNTFLPVAKRVLAMAGLLAVIGLSSCNTVSGVGRDLENAGHAIENRANQ